VTGAAPHNGPGPVSRPTTSSEEAAQALRLRADRPRITRLSRKVLAGGTALALLLIFGAVLWALQSNRPHNQAPDELYSTDSSQRRRWLGHIATGLFGRSTRRAPPRTSIAA
jgi:type IV secretion system protein VirB10